MLIVTLIIIGHTDVFAQVAEPDIQQQLLDTGVINRLSYGLLFKKEPYRITSPSGKWSHTFILQLPTADNLRPDIAEITKYTKALIYKVTHDSSNNRPKRNSFQNKETVLQQYLSLYGGNNSVFV